MFKNKFIKNKFIKTVLSGAGVALAYFIWQVFFMRNNVGMTAVFAAVIFAVILTMACIFAMQAAKNGKTYIFDMDGTLVDSVYALEDGTKKFLDAMEIEYPDNIVEIITPLGYTGAAKYIQSLGVDRTVDELTKMMKNSMIDEYENHIPAKPHAINLLKRLRDEGHTLAVLTASPHFLLDPCFKRLGIYDLFDYVWSTDDFGLTKSDTKIYHEAAKILGVKAEDCTFFDDNINNIRTAKEAGLHTVAVYDVTSKNSEDELKKIAEKYIYSFKEI